jgi:WD40 repeat protein
MRKFFFLVLLSVCLNNYSDAQSVLWVNYSHPQVRATYDATFSPDGLQVLSGSECHEAHIRIFDAANGNILWDYQLDSNLYCVQGVKFAAGGTKFIAVEETGKLLLFDYSGGTPVIIDTIITGNAAALAADFNAAGDKIIIGGYLTYQIYDLNTGQFAAPVNAHLGYIWSIQYSNSQQYILTGSTDDKVKMFSSSGTLIRTFNGHTGDVLTAKFSMDDSLIVSGSRDDKIRVWNANTGSVVHTLTGHSGDVFRIDISPDNRFIASGAADATIRIWDLQSGTLLSTINDTSGAWVYSVKWSPDGKKLLVGNGATQVVLYDVNSIVGVSEVTPSRVVLSWPNPIERNSLLQFSETRERIQTFRLYDLNGKCVYDVTENSGIRQVRIPELSSGNYTYVLQFDDNVEVPGKLQIK